MTGGWDITILMAFSLANLRRKICDLNPASAEFTGDARRQGRRCIRILQVLANAADSAKSALPEGKLFPKNHPTFAPFKLMHVKNLRCFNNALIIQLENFFLKTVYAGFRCEIVLILSERNGACQTAFDLQPNYCQKSTGSICPNSIVFLDR